MTTATKYKTYPKYKSSGIDWLGNIPAGWEAKRLRFLATLKKGRKPEENTESVDGLPYLTMDYLRGQEEPIRYTPSQESVVVDDKEILLLWDGANAGEFVEGSKGILSSTMAEISFDERKLDSKYYFYFLKSFEKKLRELTIGMGIPHVSGDIVRDCITTIPSDLEQHTIVDFLDREMARIDDVVGKKQKLIDLLKEKRQALITHAVTKGLDSKAKIKPSGIDWLGDIPDGWEVKRLNYLMKNIVDKALDNKESEFIVALENIESWTGIFISPEDQKMPEGELKRFAKGDVLFGKLRPYLAKALLAGQDGLCVGEALVFRTTKHLLNKFLIYRILSRDFIDYIDGSTQGAKMPRAEWEFIKTLKIVFPSTEEQQKIVDYIDRETAKIDEVMKKVEIQVEKLQEYRQALITSAVTGKIMVN